MKKKKMKKLLIGGVATATLMGLSPISAFAADTMTATYDGVTVESMIKAVDYYNDGGTYTSDGETIDTTVDNTSAVYAENSGTNVTLSNVTITSSANDSTGYDCELNGGSGLTDALGSQYGLDAAVYANDGGTITITGNSSITTSGLIGNAVYATYGGTIYLTGTADSPITITTSGLNAHGVDVTYGGTTYLTYVDITTTGAHASAIATDFGGGTDYVYNCTVDAEGTKSAGIYSCGYNEGYIYVEDSTIVSALDAGAAVASGGKLEVYNSSITGVNALSVMFGGDSAEETDPIIIDGSSLTSTGGAAIIWKNGNSTVTLQNGTTVTASNGILAEAGDFFGDDPSEATLVLSDETLTQGYELLADSGSTLATYLEDGTTFTGWTSGDVSMDIDSTSTWNVSADSTVTSLTNSGGTVNLLYSDGTYYTLTDTGNLSGSGTFKMNVDLSDTSLLNTITVDGTASGTYAIYFTGQNAAYLATNSLTSPIKVLSTGTSTATITGGGDFGAYRWSIAAGSTLSSSYSSSDYYLYNTYTPSTPAYAAIDTTASNVAAWYGEMNEIANHMNELRVASKYNDDFWSRTYSNKFTVKPNGGKSFTEVMSGVEVGKDNASFFDGGKKVTGFLVGAGKADNSFSTGGSGSVDSYYGAAYSSWIKNDGSYFDLIGKYNSFSNDFSATLLGGEITDTASYHSNSFGLSAQIGKRLEKGNGVFIDPQASVTVLRSNSADYTSTNGLAVSLPANTSMQFKLGGTFGKKTTDSNGDSRQVYGKLAWVQNSSSDSKTIVDEASFDSNLKGSQVVTGIGFIQEVGSHEIYINVEKSWGNDLNYYGGNLGYRWKF